MVELSAKHVGDLFEVSSTLQPVYSILLGIIPVSLGPWIAEQEY